MKPSPWVATLLEEPFEGKLSSLDGDCLYLVLGIEPSDGEKEEDEEDFDYPVIEYRVPLSRDYLKDMWNM